MRLPKMTTRRWMALVAAVAVIIVAAQMSERRGVYLSRAERYARGEQMCRAAMHAYRTRTSSFNIDPSFDQDALAEKYEQMATWYSGMKQKYEHAASRPQHPQASPAVCNLVTFGHDR